MKPRRQSPRRAACALAFVLAFVPRAALADPPRGFGALDLGAGLSAPLSGAGGSNRFYPAAAFEGGLELNDLMQVGGRVRFFPGSVGEHDDLRWGLSTSMGSVGALVRLTFEPTRGLGLSAGASVGYALFGDCYSHGTSGAQCAGSGVAVGLDLRISYLLRRHLGLHLSFERNSSPVPVS